jgi:hypothetical protein
MINFAEVFLYLVPGAQFGIMDNDYERVEWQSETPKPSLAECEHAWPIVVQARTVAAANKSVLEQLAANDAKATRAISEAIRTGDMSRLEAHEAAQAELRAQLTG